jgi:hypothetical protein
MTRPAKILLVNPPFYRLLYSHYDGLSLGMAYMAACLRNAGIDAWLYNADFTGSQAYATPHSLYKVFRQQYANIQACEEVLAQETANAIVAFAPDIVGYNCYTANITTVQKISSLVKREAPGVVHTQPSTWPRHGTFPTSTTLYAAKESGPL